jgi:hypothetical protein
VSVNEPARASGILRKNLLAANFVGVSLLISVGYYKAPPNPTVTSTCQTVREVEYCHGSDGGSVENRLHVVASSILDAELFAQSRHELWVCFDVALDLHQASGERRLGGRELLLGIILRGVYEGASTCRWSY